MRTLQNVVQPGGCVGVSPAGYAVQLLLQPPRVSQQPHLQLRYRHTVICMAGTKLTPS